MARRSFSLACLAAALLAAAGVSPAAVKPDALFSNNAVLQQGIAVPVWGTAKDGERVTVRFENQKVTATAGRDGRWMVRLKPLKAGGPFSMTISGENKIELKNILVGEVWICSGQSNMAFTLKGSVGGQEAIETSADPTMRLFTVPRNPKETPQIDVEASWQECGPETSPGFTAVGYYFGRELRKTLNVPVGLINSSYGGTRVEAWTSKRVFPSDPEWETMVKRMPDWAKKSNAPNVLYNGMIAPLIPYAIRGTIWYQGEANAGKAFDYRTSFPAMIRNWREDWGQRDFPFLFVQLAPYTKINPQPENSAWAELREAQLLTTKTCLNTAMAVITDVGNPNDIHPKHKQPVGERLALAALALAYHQPVVYQGPTYASMAVRGDRAVLYFDNIGKGLEARGGDLTGFTIAGDDGVFHNAKATIQGNRVVVSCPEVPHPAAVRYGWANCPVVNLWNKDGLPASPFRTDDFPITTGPK